MCGNTRNTMNYSGHVEKANASWCVGCFVSECDIKSTSNLKFRSLEFVNIVIFKNFSAAA